MSNATPSPGPSPDGSPYLLHRGDALAVLRDLPSGSVDAVITDPPYSSGGRRENARSVRVSMTRAVENDEWIAGDSMSTAGFVYLMREIAIESRRILREGGHLLAFIDWRMYPNLAAAIESADLRQHPTLVWDKAHFGMGAIFRNQHEWVCHFSKGQPSTPNRRDTANVLRYPNDRADDHPTQKPLELMRRLVDVVTAPGGTVLDPFMGSGTTGVAAILEGRRFIGVEMTEHYHAVAERRLAEAVGNYQPDGDQDALDFGGVA